MQNISVIGSGTMGNGIAHVFAQAGFNVILVDLSAEALERAKATIRKNLDRQASKGVISTEDVDAIHGRITFQSNYEGGIANSDLVVEAIVEKLDVKRAVFKQLDGLCKPSALLASNTSSISITSLASATGRPDKVIGMHFMNPVPVMKLVEIIRGYSTSQETMDAIIAATQRLGKVPVEVNDYPGFVSNRILMPMINEAIQTLFEGVAGVNEIDEVMMLGMAHPMGPLKLADFIGLDVCLNILNVLHDGFKQPRYAPCPLLVNMVNAGKLGAKTGEGFYSWVSGKADKVSPKFLRMKNEEVIMNN